MIEPRLTLSRNGVADIHLDGVIAAQRYVAPTPMQTVSPTAAIQRAPEQTAEQLDQLLFGERFDVLEAMDGWVFGQARRDGYVGFVRAEALADVGPAPTHWVRSLRTFAFAQPSIKTRQAGLFSTNALVTVEAVEGRFAKIVGSGWIVVEHLSRIGDWAVDPAEVAIGYLGAPYLWGGRDSLGLDCSGLVQQALYACGRSAPRDSDLQRVLGDEVTPGEDLSGLARNDLVFWRGHVGIMLDETHLLHANAHHMAVTLEHLAQAVARIGSTDVGAPVAFRRLTAHPTGHPTGHEDHPS